MTTILLPCSPLNPRRVDDDFAAEADAARANGFAIEFVDAETIARGEVAGGARGSRPCLYRGWMLASKQYGYFASALAALGYAPMTKPADYRRHHEYPGAYAALSDLMPESLIVPAEELGNLEAVADAMANRWRGGALLKDYVKSRKHEWLDACFIPDVADRANAMRVLRNFVERQGSDLSGGLVMRQSLDLATLGRHAISGMPIAVEYRAFYLAGRPLAVAPYWDGADYADAPSPPAALLAEIGARFGDGFFSADVAMQSSGAWKLIETGDGQVSQIPESLGEAAFYRALAERLGAA
jgi:hypothetical protein